MKSAIESGPKKYRPHRKHELFVVIWGEFRCKRNAFAPSKQPPKLNRRQKRDRNEKKRKNKRAESKPKKIKGTLRVSIVGGGPVVCEIGTSVALCLRGEIFVCSGDRIKVKYIQNKKRTPTTDQSNQSRLLRCMHTAVSRKSARTKND